MATLNNFLVRITSIAALLVIFGVIAKNSAEQMGVPNHPIYKPLGMGMFTLGWIVTAYILSVGKPNKLSFIIPSAVILGAVMAMKELMSNKQAVPAYIPAAFAAAWVALGYFVGDHLHGFAKYSGLLASALVLGSMMHFLPIQREKCIVDGPGMSMFTIAWGIIIYLNSNRHV
jgi:hypothetical protein